MKLGKRITIIKDASGIPYQRSGYIIAGTRFNTAGVNGLVHNSLWATMCRLEDRLFFKRTLYGIG